MEKEVTFRTILDHINKSMEDNRANCSIGFFITDNYVDRSVDVENIVVKKPLITISSFIEDNNLYYNINLRFKSLNDADYKQIWKFICRFVNKAKHEGQRLQAGEDLEKVSSLSVSIVPELYKGKYFALADMPFPEMFTRFENAYDGIAEISFVCEEANFGILSADDDIIDRRSIEQEVMEELEAEDESLVEPVNNY